MKNAKKLIRTLGAGLILTPAKENISGAIKGSKDTVLQTPHIFIPYQLENPDNPCVHYETTARELWQLLSGEIVCFVAGIGSVGTLQGIRKFLEEHEQNIKIIVMEPKNHSAILSHEPGLH